MQPPFFADRVSYHPYPARPIGPPLWSNVSSQCQWNLPLVVRGLEGQFNAPTRPGSCCNILRRLTAGKLLHYAPNASWGTTAAQGHDCNYLIASDQA